MAASDLPSHLTLDVRKDSESLPNKSEVELPSDYYLTNFRTLIDFVTQRYWTLLSEVEQAFYQVFIDLSKDAQCLLVRMYTRRGEQFRIDKLVYSEINNTEQAIDELATVGLVDALDISVDFDWIRLFSKHELAQIFDKPEWKKLPRPELETKLAETFYSIDLSNIKRRLVNIYTVPKALFDIYRLLFFGNLRQDLTDFVLQDLGLINYEDYIISDTSLAFTSAEQIAAHFLYYQALERYYEVEEWSVHEIESVTLSLPENIWGDHNLERRVSRLLNRCAMQYERLDEYDKAYQLYQLSSMVPAAERAIRCLDKLGDFQRALQQLELLALNSNSEQDQQFVELFRNKLKKKLGQSVTSRKVYKPDQSELQLIQEHTRVELDTLQYFSQQGDVFWVENYLFNAIFCLYYWDIIFADVDGAFFNPFQLAPSDIYEKDFCQRRRQQLEQLQNRTISDELFIDHVLRKFEKKSTVTTRFANLQFLDEALLKKALERIPVAHLRSIITRILHDPKENRNGMPDLIMFPDAGDYELIEVKGPGDRLQKNQLRWFYFYRKHQIPARVVSVSWTDTE